MAAESEIQATESVVHPSAALAGGSSHNPSAARAPRADVVARVADFAELTAPATSGPPAPLDRLLDVTVAVTAELGRVTLPISAVLSLNVNSVLELNRSVAEPVDLMVQGVLLARGEVVVVNDCFAIRIKEIAEPKKRG
ncbi:MAG TPA: FliM/FliN family flagellar motor switch protein [Gemmataceae bacterium]|nr:FliM/FliN family flagellar motor switch protein [Gemmataceae bacterium]